MNMNRLMNRVADETTIHGIKEAWYANRIGRVFYAIVFTACSVLMLFQLKGIFQAYLNESIGTRLTISTALDMIEVPSFYFCNDMWYSNLPGVKKLAEGGLPKSMYDEVEALHISDYDGNDTVHPTDRIWRLARLQYLMNGIIMLAERERFDHALIPEPEENDYIYARVYDEIKVKMGDSMHTAAEKKLGEPLSSDSSFQTTQASQAHGIFNQEHILLNFESTAELHSLFLKLSNRLEGKLRLSLDGVCWEFSQGAKHQETTDAVGEKHEHVVTHYGGLGRQFGKLVHLYLTTPGSETISSDDNPFLQAVVAAVENVMKYSLVYRHLYSTHVSIATQNEPHLLFNQKIRIDQYAPRVLIRYWMKKSVFKGRKGRPCRSEWTELDQAHCNQEHARERGDLTCEQYLPASNHFPETVVTNETCFVDHAKVLQLSEPAASKQKIGDRAPFPLRISSASRKQVLNSLTKNSDRCPRPCSKTLFQFETTYPTSDVSEKIIQCGFALGFFFVPFEEIHEMWLGNQSFQVKDRISQSDIDGSIYFSAIKQQSISYGLDAQKIQGGQLPCSFVEFERSETHGQVSEEYFLHTVSDLAASVGGTLSLYIGASIMCIVQILYLCCLKKMFKRIQHGCRRGKGRGRDASEDDVYITGSNGVSRNRGHPI